MERAEKCQQAPQHSPAALRPGQGLPSTKCQSKTFIKPVLSSLLGLSLTGGQLASEAQPWLREATAFLSTPAQVVLDDVALSVRKSRLDFGRVPRNPIFTSLPALLCSFFPPTILLKLDTTGLH